MSNTCKKRVLVTGASGLVGSAVVSRLKFFNDAKALDVEILPVTHRDVDLTVQAQVKSLFDDARPTHVVHTAARVGGIGRNLSTPYLQFFDNIMMNTLVIDESRKSGVDGLLSFSSVCAYPKDAAELTDSNLHDGPPYPAHYSYAMAKRMVDVQIATCNKQYGTHYKTVIPSNIFGINDNFNLDDGHVVPSLIHRCFLAKRDSANFVVWGDGTPVREFITSDDIAEVCVRLLFSQQNLPERIVVPGKEHTILKIVEMVCRAFDYPLDRVVWDAKKPNGQMKRPVVADSFVSLFSGFQFSDIEPEIQKVVNFFVSNYPNVRL